MTQPPDNAPWVNGDNAHWVDGDFESGADPVEPVEAEVDAGREEPEPQPTDGTITEG